MFIYFILKIDVYAAKTTENGDETNKKKIWTNKLKRNEHSLLLSIVSRK